MSLSDEEMFAEVEIKSSAEKYFQLISCKPNEVIQMTDKILSCDLIDGEFGKKGLVLNWTFTLDGLTNYTSKETYEELDKENYSITIKMTEGDMLKAYENLKMMVKVTPKGQGSVVKWTIKYRKVKPEIPKPQLLLNYLIQGSKDVIDVYLQKN